MVVRKRGVMPDGTQIQIEDWKNDYPNVVKTISIAAYPKAKNTGTHQWVKKGETFRLELSREFKTDEFVENLYEKLISGRISLEDLDKHYYNGDDDRFYMGLIASEA